MQCREVFVNTIAACDSRVIVDEQQLTPKCFRDQEEKLFYWNRCLEFDERIPLLGTNPPPSVCTRGYPVSCPGPACASWRGEFDRRPVPGGAVVIPPRRQRLLMRRYRQHRQPRPRRRGAHTPRLGISGTVVSPSAPIGALARRLSSLARPRRLALDHHLARPATAPGRGSSRSDGSCHCRDSGRERRGGLDVRQQLAAQHE